MAQRWGGKVVHLTDQQFYYIGRQPGVSSAPFTGWLAVDYDKKTVYCLDPTWYNLLHEMGHVFASRLPPRQSSDFDFLGWEWVVARQLKGVRKWLTGNADYGVGPEADLGDLTPAQVHVLLKERLEEAVRQGLVVNGKAVSVRG